MTTPDDPPTTDYMVALKDRLFLERLRLIEQHCQGIPLWRCAQ
jgi:hypothetical protein